MMDQNRCLLDVINDPQLLQSFLDSGPDATSTTNTVTPANSTHTSSVTTTTNSNSSHITSSTQSEKETAIPESTANNLQENSYPSHTGPVTGQEFVSTELKASTEQTNVTQYNPEVQQPQTPPRQHSESMDAMLQKQPDTTLPQPNPPSSNDQASIPNLSQVNASAPSSTADVSPATTIAFAPTSTASASASTTSISTMSPSTIQVTMPNISRIQTPVTTTPSSMTTPSVSSPGGGPKTPAPSTGTKRAARGGGRSTTRAPRAKNSKTAAANQSTSVVTKQHNLQQSLAYNPNSGPQILIQNPNTNIRQPALLGQTMGSRQTLGQGLASLPQQRVIQIQTPNGPMYFAIASPSPQNISNNDNSMMMNQQSSIQQQPQGIRLQGNTTVMLNGQQMSNMQQQRISSPFMSNQMAMSNRSLEQNQYCTNPSGQIVMQNQSQNSQIHTTQQQSQSMSLQTNSTVMLNGQQVHNVQQQQQPRLPLNIMPSQTIGMQNQQQDQQNQIASNQSNQILVQGQNIQNFQQQQQSGQQGNTSMMVNGQQQLQQQQSQQPQQQQQLVMSPQQQNLGSPVMSNQSISLNNQQSPTITTSQPQHMIMPSTSQSSIMMPRVSNLILNRPMGSSGQLLPGQQQFIIQTANGPMLLAIPSPQQHQIQTNQTMIEYGSPIQQQQNRMSNITLQQQSLKQPSTPVKQQHDTKPGLNLGDLLLSHGILPEEKSPPSSPNCQDSSQKSIPMSTIQSTPQSMDTIQSIPVTQPQLQQPVRIAINPDGSVIFPPHIFGTMRPMINNMQNVVTNNALNSVNNLPLNTTTTTTTSVAAPSTTPTNAKKGTKATKGTKSTTTKRPRSKKNEIEKFPTLKTPSRRQQLAAQQQMQSVTAMIPISVIVDNSNNSMADVKPNISENSQVPLSKIVTPVVQTAALQPLSSGSMSTSFITNDTNLVGGPATNNQASNLGPATSLSQTTSSALVSPRTATNTSIAAASGNVDSNPHPTIDNVTSSRLIESIVPISSSTSMTSTSASIVPENVKTEPNTITETNHNSTTLVALSNSIINETSSDGIVSSSQQHNLGQSSGNLTEVSPQPILRQLEADQEAALNPQIKQPFRSLEDACKRLLRYHVFDSPTVSETDIKKVDQIFEVAAESLLAKKKEIYDKFRLLVLKQSMNIVPKAEQVMIEQIFINEEQAFLKKARDFLNDGEILDPDSLLPAERQDTTSSTLSPMKQDHNEMDQDNDCAINATNYLAYGDKSPELRSEDLDNLHRSPSKMDNWLMSDKWNKSRFSSVPDSEAALAIESILDDELS